MANQDIIQQDTYDLEWWTHAGRPHTWKLVESVEHNGKQIHAWVDTAFAQVGWSRDAKKAPTQNARGKHFAQGPNFVILDCNYYGPPNYIWVRP